MFSTTMGTVILYRSCMAQTRAPTAAQTRPAGWCLLPARGNQGKSVGLGRPVRFRTRIGRPFNRGEQTISTNRAGGKTCAPFPRRRASPITLPEQIALSVRSACPAAPGFVPTCKKMRKGTLSHVSGGFPADAHPPGKRVHSAFSALSAVAASGAISGAPVCLTLALA